MNILIVGSGGQLGQSLCNTPPSGVHMTCMDYPEIDITSLNSVATAFAQCRPDVVVNAAAYTAVDDAENNPHRAYEVNASGAKILSNLCLEFNARLVHISTDFVFRGDQSTPYLPFDDTAPLSVYGKSKLDGEAHVLGALANSAVIVRTAWLYSAFGNNFVKTMLRLMTTRDEVRVVGDQIGSPTWATSLAQVVWTVAANPKISGIFHWTDAGETSWYEFAVTIQDYALELEILPSCIPIRKISTHEFPTAASRPQYSVLDCSDTCIALNLKQTDWKENLRTMLEELRHHA